MLGREIITMSRDFLDDNALPQLWKDIELVRYLNRVNNRFCVRTRILSDFTSSFCTVEIPCNTTVIPLDSRIIGIKDAKIDAESISLDSETEANIVKLTYDWKNATGTPRYFISNVEQNNMFLYPKFENTYEILGSSNISFVAATSRITKASGMDIYAAGDRIEVTGTTSNDQTVTVVSSAATYVAVSETLVNENNTSAILRRIEGDLVLSVYRTQLVPFTVANLDSVSPEYNSIYHELLIDGILANAYLKRDLETYDPKKAKDYEDQFRVNMANAKDNIDSMRMSPRALRPHPGAI